METVIRIKPRELTPDLLNKVIALFKNEHEIEIAISTVADFGLTAKESRVAYKKRISKAIENLENGKDTVSLNENEFDSLSSDLLCQK